MATKQEKDYGVNFVNIDLRFKANLYFGKEDVIPDEVTLFKWIESLAKDFWRVGFSYSERNSSFTASATYRGGKTTDKSDCLTQHGRTPLSALLKLYVVLELAGGRELGFPSARDAIGQLEDYIEDAVDKLK